MISSIYFRGCGIPLSGVKAKQCGLDLVFPCITMKMFVSAIMSLLLLVTAVLPSSICEPQFIVPVCKLARWIHATGIKDQPQDKSGSGGIHSQVTQDQVEGKLVLSNEQCGSAGKESQGVLCGDGLATCLCLPTEPVTL